MVNTVEPLYNGNLGDRRKCPPWRGGRYGELGLSYDKFILGSTTSVMVISSCLLHPIMSIQSKIIYREIAQKNLNVLKQNVNATKRTSIVDNLCLLQQYKWNTIKIRCHN